MYGLVNKAIEDLVLREHGPEAWARIADRAGFEDAGFISMDAYPDAVTYGLVSAASIELDVPPEQLLEAFGHFWILYTAREGYGELLDLSGRSFEEFLFNLDNLHTRLGLSMPDLRPPSFECEKLDGKTFRLHYRSERQGLTPMVVGLIRGLADKFGLAIDLRIEADRRGGADHDVFLIELRSSEEE
jgi:hypothetical protein